MSWLFNPAPRDAFHDKLWKRADLAAWDERWGGLSVAARRHFVEDIKAAVRPGSQAPTTPASRFAQDVLDELQAAGLITVQAAGAGQPRVTVSDKARGFATRLRALKRYHLLDASRSSEVVGYADYAYASYDLGLALAEVVERAVGVSGWALAGHPVELFVSRRRWPGWVCDFLKDPVARAVAEAVEAAGGAVPLAQLAGRLPEHRPEAVRAALDALVNHLALVEDLDPTTYEIVVGILPAVRADRARAVQPRPPLDPAGPPRDLGPEGGIFVPDLRAVLLELAGGRARVRQDHRLYQKDHDRFLGVLDALPGWLSEDAEVRLRQAWHIARLLGLTREVKASGGQIHLELSPAGQRWLASPAEEQYLPLFAGIRAADQDDGYRALDDAAFLGSEITAVPAKKGRRDDWSWSLAPADREPLRAALHRALGPLPVGVFYRVRDVMAHFSFGEHNPLYLGGDRTAVVVRFAGQRIPPLEEHLEDLGKELLRHFLGRLVEFGAVQAGRAADGELLVARRPRLDAYFGAEAAAAAPPAEAPRVVVQPDFSVIVIGVNPAPAAELAPFCDRVRQGGHGALTFRLSRESVMRGVAAGLTGEQVLARLEGHSTNPVPQNVLTQVRSWCDWVRTVTATPAVLLRCPDAETANRVQGVLGKAAERVAETVVALRADAVTEAVKKKLQEQGVLLARGDARP